MILYKYSHVYMTISILFFKVCLFLIWTIFKVFIEFVTILLLFYVLAFWPPVMWNQSQLPGTEPASPALEGEVLTTRPPGKSLIHFNLSRFPPSLS